MLIGGNLYIPDTSALIAAWEERYPPDIFPSVWEFLDGLNGRLRICEEVREEIKQRTAHRHSGAGRNPEPRLSPEYREAGGRIPACAGMTVGAGMAIW